MNIFHALEEATHVSWVIWSSLFAAALLLGSGLLVRARLAAAQGGLVPDAGFSLRNVLELLVEMLRGLAEQNMGPNWRKYFPIIGTIFFFILISNLMGLVPGLAGSTSSADTTWAWAIISFVVHQYVGIKEHGFGYINHFLGPDVRQVPHPAAGAALRGDRAAEPRLARVHARGAAPREHVRRPHRGRQSGCCSCRPSCRPSSWVWA